ncbi:hypothetical protein ABH920_002994 [Catenulispora sp. EB89]|uniref:hypothetical protein n=1 Tax=Catenulispora sp. EB89 TaxID=3156257 RepID=UPI003513622D
MGALRVRFELDIEDPGAERLSHLVGTWLDGGSTAVAAQHRRRLDEGPELSRKAFTSAIPCGPAFGAWGLLALERTTAPRKSLRIPTTAAVRSLPGRVDDALTSARIALYTLDAQGYPETSHIDMWVIRNPKAPQTLAFMFAVPESDLADPAIEKTCVDFLHSFAEQVDPLYGETAYDDGMPGAKTVIETLVGPPWRSYRDTLPTARRQLRGYGWLTVVPRELVPTVGGIAGLRASGAFAEVAPLPSGAVWLRATEHYGDYSGESAEAIVRALAPILPPGLPDLRFGRTGVPYKVALVDPSTL